MKKYEVYTANDAPFYLRLFMSNVGMVLKHGLVYALRWVDGDSHIGIGLTEHSAKLACKDEFKVNLSPELIPKTKKKRKHK